VALEELEMTLFASLPFGNRLEGLDVPADERCQRNGVVCLRPATAWFSRCTSRCFAQLAAAERCAKVRYSGWINARPLRMRMIAV
jgi:hypothetical protein